MSIGRMQRLSKPGGHRFVVDTLGRILAIELEHRINCGEPRLGNPFRASTINFPDRIRDVLHALISPRITRVAYLPQSGWSPRLWSDFGGVWLEYRKLFSANIFASLSYPSIYIGFPVVPRERMAPQTM